MRNQVITQSDVFDNGSGMFQIIDRAATTNEGIVGALKILAEDGGTDRAVLLGVLGNVATTNMAIVDSIRVIKEEMVGAEE